MNGLEETLRLTLKNLSEACAADSVVGKPMVTEDGSVTIPVSRVSYGIVTGGGEGEGTSKRGGSPLAAAGGCGMTVTPVGFAAHLASFLKVRVTDLVVSVAELSLQTVAVRVAVCSVAGNVLIVRVAVPLSLLVRTKPSIVALGVHLIE